MPDTTPSIDPTPLGSRWLRIMLAAFSPEEIERSVDAIKSDAFERALNADLDRVTQLMDYFQRLARESQLAAVAGLALIAAGDLCRRQGQFAEAFDRYQQAGVIFDQAGHAIGWARAISIGCIAGVFGSRDIQPLVAQLDRARAVFAQHQEWYRLAALEDHIGMMQFYLGDLDAAAQAYERGYRALPSGPDADYSRAALLSNHARVQEYRGELAAALVQYQQAREIHDRLDYPQKSAVAWLNIAGIERSRWHLREALFATQQAIAGFSRAKVAHSVAAAQILRADCLLVLNRTEEARAVAAEAIANLRATQASADRARAAIVNARALRQCGHAEEAALLLRVEEQSAREGGFRRLAIEIAIERAATLIALRQFDAAREVVLAILRIPRIAETAILYATALLTGTEATLAMGRADWAFPMAQAAVRHAETLDAPAIHIQGWWIVGRAARSLGETSTSLAAYEQAITTLTHQIDLIMLDQRADFLVDKDALFVEAAVLALEDYGREDRPMRAVRYLELGRAQAAWVGAARRRVALAETDARTRMRASHRLLREQIAALDPDSPTFAAMRQALIALSRQLFDQHTEEHGPDAEAIAVDIAQVIAAMPSAGVAIAYLVAANDIVIFVVRPTGVEARTVQHGAVKAHRLAQFVTQHLDHLADRMESEEPAAAAQRLAAFSPTLHRTLNQLWDLLVKPIADLLPPKGAPLFVAPHGFLHFLPFDALYDGQQYAIEHWEIQLIPSLLALIPRQPSEETAGQPPLAIGCSANNSLPDAIASAQHIAALLGGESWVEEAASVDRLLAEGSQRAIIHVMAHGQMRPYAPHASYLRLADGLFHPIDAQLLDLHGCQLVTLAACESGRGSLRGGDEQIGFRRAFFLAGASAVLATLWRVEMTATRRFMDQFYTAVTCELPMAQAHRAAQLELIGDRHTWTHHPFFWAGFQLMRAAF